MLTRPLPCAMSTGSTTWTFTYDANGMRTRRTNGTLDYRYVYNGNSLSQLTVGNNTLYFAYSADGTPLTVTYNGTTYYYVTNIQGNVIAILNSAGNPVVTYTYDAWGNPLSTTGSMASTLGTHNPLRYRGYVYDQETNLYYLQSRYYSPIWGRFINGDNQLSTGSDLTGLNLFAYCGNNPVNRIDSNGYAWQDVKDWFAKTWDNFEETVHEFVEDVKESAYSIYYNATRFHFEDRIAANGEHPTYNDVVNNNEWQLLPESQAKYHIDDVGEPELKYIHPDGREAVFNGDTLEPMTDPRYMATYNYYALHKIPETDATVRDYIKYGYTWVMHGVTDVIPYWVTGYSNTREQFEQKVITLFS